MVVPPISTPKWSFLVGKAMGLLGKPTILGNNHMGIYSLYYTPWNPENWGRFLFWRSYFSKGLVQPPSQNIHITFTIFVETVSMKTSRKLEAFLVLDAGAQADVRGDWLRGLIDFHWYTPWKMNGWNLQIIHLERKMIWTKPPWGHVPAVNLLGCNLRWFMVFCRRRRWVFPPHFDLR